MHIELYRGKGAPCLEVTLKKKKKIIINIMYTYVEKNDKANVEKWQHLWNLGEGYTRIKTFLYIWIYSKIIFF